MGDSHAAVLRVAEGRRGPGSRSTGPACGSPATLTVMPETMARRTCEAHREAGASHETAAGAAGDLGDLTGEVRNLRWMVATVIAIQVVTLAAVFQVALRLGGTS